MPDKPAEFTSDEQREAHIAALKVELKHLEQTGQPNRADEVRGHLERLEGAPQKRESGKAAEKRPRGAAKETRA
jgi:hypothetical protein